MIPNVETLGYSQSATAGVDVALGPCVNQWTARDLGSRGLDLFWDNPAKIIQGGRMMANYEVVTLQGTPATERFNNELNTIINDGWEILSSHVLNVGNF